MHSICFENKNPVRISYEYGTFRLVGNPQIYLGAKQKVINITPEEFPNKKKPLESMGNSSGVHLL